MIVAKNGSLMKNWKWQFLYYLIHDYLLSMRAESIFVAATNQHVGKTTSTLGLASAMQQMGINVGYCKPVGQQYLDFNNLRVDKDTVLFAELLNFDIVPELHSPVILGQRCNVRIP